MIAEFGPNGATLLILDEGLHSAPLETYAVWPAAKNTPLRLKATIDAPAANLSRLE